MTATTTIILILYFIRGSLGHVLPQSSILGIAGGHSVNIEDAPFMAALLHVKKDINDAVVWCGGSIIHKQFVLTTAFCCILNPYVVRVGSTRYNEGGQLHEVEKYIRHESYEYLTKINNVGLLKLSEPVTFGPSVALIKLADDTVDIHNELTANVSGWGNTTGNLQSTPDLQQVTVTVSPPSACNKYYFWEKKLREDKQICVYNKGKGACFDDRGGPLTTGHVQIGIKTYGDSCTGAPNVYEKVAPQLQWIRNTIKQNL